MCAGCQTGLGQRRQWPVICETWHSVQPLSTLADITELLHVQLTR